MQRDATTCLVDRAIFSDGFGNELWKEEPYPFSRANAVGDYIVHVDMHYTVTGCAIHDGTMYTNLEEKKEDKFDWPYTGRIAMTEEWP